MFLYEVGFPISHLFQESCVNRYQIKYINLFYKGGYDDERKKFYKLFCSI